MSNQTIAAIATGPVRAAIGILRLSGPEAVSCVSAVFRPQGGGQLQQYGSRRMIYGRLLDAAGAPIDQVLATFSLGPDSYTGEDTAELHCHGSPTVLAMGLEALFQAGARQAGPGEFTRRAFLNGKLDLTQAEAVADLIDAQTPAAARCAAGQLAGALGRRCAGVYDGLVNIMAHFHAVLDYPDEDIDPFQAQQLDSGLAEAAAELRSLIDSYRRGRFLTGGVPCAIVGRPNAGKSSLLNALLGFERAIVTPVPGTTRDTVEERCTLGGVLLRLIDTAGLRESSDLVERLGVERSRAALEQAELALFVVDASAPLEEADIQVMNALSGVPQVICVANKVDLPVQADLAGLQAKFPVLSRVSAATGVGLPELEQAVGGLFPPGLEQGELLTNARQAEAASRALEGVEAARQSLGRGMTPDAVLVDVEQAMYALGELTGRSIREDVTDRIFTRFCVGK